MSLKRKVAIVIILLFSITVTYSFASGYLSETLSNSESINGSELTNLADEPSNNSNSTTDSAPTSTATATQQLIPIPVEFIINVTSRITLTANVNLNDGMDRDEAILVAELLFPQVHSHATYELKSAEVNDANVWTVCLPWGAISPDGNQENHSHSFVAIIDPSTRTIQFNTCY